MPGEESGSRRRGSVLGRVLCALGLHRWGSSPDPYDAYLRCQRAGCRSGATGPDEHRLPSAVVREVERGEIADPMWYVGPLWPTVEDVLDMSADGAAALRRGRDG